MIHTSSLTSSGNRATITPSQTTHAEIASQINEGWVQKSPEEEQLSRLGDKVDDAFWIKFKPAPYPNRSLGKESLSLVKEFVTKERTISKVFTKNAKNKLLTIFNSISFLASAKGKEEKLKAFLNLPFWTEENYVFRGKLRLAQVFTVFLKNANDDVLKIKGGIARHLVLPWVQQSLKERLDTSLKITPERKDVLNANRPDWDFYKYTHSPDQIRTNNHIFYVEIAKAIFNETDPDLLVWYAIIVQKFICRSAEGNTGIEHNEYLALQFEDGPEVGLTQQQVGRNSQFFELHGLDISIAKSAMNRWAANPTDKTISKQDLAEVLVCTDRVHEDEGLQASLDLGMGLLHTRDTLRQKQAFSRYIYWITNLCRSYEPTIRQTFLNYVLEYVRKDHGICAAECILDFHKAHNLGHYPTLNAMLVNTWIALREEKHPLTTRDEFLKHSLSSVDIKHNCDIFTQCLTNTASSDNTLDVLKLFSFLKALCVKEGPVQAYFTKGQHLQVIDTLSCLFELNPTDIDDICSKIGKEYSIDTHNQLFDRVLKGAVFHPEQVKQVSRLTTINWVNIETLATKLLSNSSEYHQKLGFLLLTLVVQSNAQSNSGHLALIKHFPKVYMISSKDEQKALVDNLQHTVRNSAYEYYLEELLSNRIHDIPDEKLLSQEFVISLAPVEIDLALHYWNSNNSTLSAEERMELGKKLIAAIKNSSPRCALSILAEIQPNLNQQDELNLFLSVIELCSSNQSIKWQTTTLLQKVLLIILRRPPIPATLTPEPRRAHGKKRQTHLPAVEQPHLKQKKSQVSTLVMASLDLCPNEEALELFELAAQQQLINDDDVSLERIGYVLNHKQGGKTSALKLTKICHENQISLNLEAQPSVALMICRELMNESDAECLELIEQFLPIIWEGNSIESKNTESIELLCKKIDRHISLEQPQDVKSLIDQYGFLLETTVIVQYKQYLFSVYLEKMDFAKAYDLLTQLHQSKSADQQIPAFLHVFHAKMKTTVPAELSVILEGLIEILLSQMSTFESEELKLTFALLIKAIENAPSKALKEKVRTGFSSLASLAKKNQLAGDLAQLLKALMLRQILPNCDQPSILSLCQLFLKDLLTTRENLELVNQLMTLYKLANSNEVEHLKLTRDVIYAMFRCNSDDQKWKLKTFEKILHCLQHLAGSQTEVITPDDLYGFVWTYQEYHDVEKLLEAAAKVPTLHLTVPYKSSYALLTSNTNHLERSCRLLVEQKACCLSFGVDVVKQVVKTNVQYILNNSTPPTKSLKYAVSCIFEYNATDDLTLIDALLYAVSTTMDAQLIGHVWSEFEKYYKQSYNSLTTSHLLLRIATLIANHNHDCIRILFERLPEWLQLNLRAELNTDDWRHFKAFKEYLRTGYPKHDLPISKLDFKTFINILSGQNLILETAGEPNLYIRTAYRDFLHTTPQTTKFLAASSLFITVVQAYGVKELLDVTEKKLASKPQKELLTIAEDVVAKVMQVRFDPCYSMLNTQMIDLLDHRFMELLFSGNLEESLINYVNQLVTLKGQNPVFLQTLLERLLERIETFPQKFSKLINSLGTHFRRHASLDAFSFLKCLMKLKRLEAHLEAFTVLKLVLKTNSSPTKEHSSMFCEIFKSVTVLDDFLNIIYDDLVGTDIIIRDWLTEEDLGLIWALYYDRLFAIIRENKAFDDDLSNSVASFGAHSEIIQKSEKGTNLVFSSCVKTLLKSIDFRLAPLSIQHANAVLGEHMCRFNVVCGMLLKVFTGMSETFVLTEDKFSAEKIRESANNYAYQVGLSEGDFDSDFVNYDNKIHTILVKILNLTNTHSHSEMNNKIYDEFPFLKNEFTLSWPNAKNKEDYFKLSLIVIDALLNHFILLESMKYLAIHMVVVQVEYLIRHYPEKINELVALLETCVHANHRIAQDYITRLNRYLIIKMMIQYPILYSHQERLYKMLILAFKNYFPYPIFPEKLDYHEEKIVDLINDANAYKTKRALEMINAIPVELVTEKTLEQYGHIIDTVLSTLFTEKYWDILFSAIKTPGIEKRILMNDLIVDMICENPILNPLKNPHRNQMTRDLATAVANHYLQSLLTIKKFLGAGSLLYPMVQLFNSYRKLFDACMWQKDDDLLKPLYIIKDLVLIELSGTNMKYFPEVVKSLDVTTALMKLNLIHSESEIIRARMLKDFIIKVDEYACDNQPSKEFIRLKCIEACEKLELARCHPNIYSILERKLFPQNQNQSLAKN